MFVPVYVLHLCLQVFARFEILHVSGMVRCLLPSLKICFLFLLFEGTLSFGGWGGCRLEGRGRGGNKEC